MSPWLRGGAALVALSEAAALALLTSARDWSASEYTWSGSLLDICAVSVARVACVSALSVAPALLLAGKRAALGATALLLLGCAVLAVAKLAGAHAFAPREAKAHALLWVAVVAPMVELALLTLSALGAERQRSRAARTVLGSHGESDGVEEDGEGSDGDESAPDALGYRKLESGDARYAGQGTSFRRVLSLAWPERYLLAAGLVCLFVASASQMVIPAMFGTIIETISKTRDQGQLDRTVLLMVAVFFVSSLFSMTRGTLFNLAGERLVARFRVRVFDSVISQDVAFFDTAQSGELMSRISNDTSKVQDAATTNVSMGLRFLAQVLVGIAIILAISWKLTLLMLSVLPPLLLVARSFGMRMKDLSRRYQDALASGSEVAEQAFSNVRTVRAFSKEDYEVARYRARIGASYTVGAAMAVAYGLFLGVVGFAAYMACALVLWYGGRLVIQGDEQLTAAKLTAFLLYTIQIAVALGGLTQLYSSLMAAVGASERMFELIDRVPAVPTDKLGARRAPPSLDDVAGLISFRGVSFSYPSRPDVQVLRDVSFDCAPGRVTALVGPSGSGKSTVINLILRFYDPTGGAVLLDGKDVRTMSTVRLRSAIGLVAQMPVLFSCSIRDNICYGVHRKVSDDEVRKAAEEANAHGFISKFPVSWIRVKEMQARCPTRAGLTLTRQPAPDSDLAFALAALLISLLFLLLLSLWPRPARASRRTTGRLRYYGWGARRYAQRRRAPACSHRARTSGERKVSSPRRSDECAR
jgi:ABC-type multidrug transport system fused ATPase/permease subunit